MSTYFFTGTRTRELDEMSPGAPHCRPLTLSEGFLLTNLQLRLGRVVDFLPEANPTIASYKASVVNFYNSTGSLARFENKNIIFYF
jgi:hypothetical protein